MNNIKQYLKKIPTAYYLGCGIVAGFIILLAIATHGFSVSKAPYDKSPFAIGDFEIAWYGIIITYSMASAYLIGIYELKKKGGFKKPYNLDMSLDGILIVGLIALICTRLYYVLFDPNFHYDGFLSVINPRDGGLAINGAIISLCFSVPIFCYIKKINVWMLLDIVLPSMLLGQVLGRWSNFMNQEAYGQIVSNLNYLPKFMQAQMFIDGAYRQPTFLFESLLNLVALVSFFIVRRFKILRVGDIFALYLVWYGLIRGLIIEPLRTDQLKIAGAPVNIIMNLAVLAPAGIILLVVKRFYYKTTHKYYYDINSENILEPIHVR
jgi:phosphatidylglycerol:prolipoprotein diacylglycerol transferase